MNDNGTSDALGALLASDLDVADRDELASIVRHAANQRTRSRPGANGAERRGRPPDPPPGPPDRETNDAFAPQLTLC